MDTTELLSFAAENEASDLIITANAPPILRIFGEMRFLASESLTAEEAKGLVYGMLDDAQIAQFEAEKELDFSLFLRGMQRFRGNVFIQRGCVGAVFRLIPNEVPSREELGLPLILEEFAMAHQGLVLVTGPTGHGKSTTQAMMIDLINRRRRCHIVTVEDPVEFVHQSRNSVIEQREVGLDTKGFANALRHVLRQAPDVILIGEIRDLETIAAALTAAETGHLVITTLHTNDAAQSMDRLVDAFPPHQQSQVRSQLALCLLGIVSQRLVPTADGKGRAVACEILKCNSAARHLIREGKIHNIYTVLETHAREGMCTMDAALKRLYLQGKITRDQAKRLMRNPEQLTASIAGGKRREAPAPRQLKGQKQG
jgi:twitching motility protein PilT